MNYAARTFHRLTAAAAVALLGAATAQPIFGQDSSLLQPKVLIVDASLANDRVVAQELAARRYDTFWATGEESLARAALARDFVDRTLPVGRAQGIDGPLAASRVFHAAVPDIRCGIEQMIVAGDRVVVHLRFTGHFTGNFKQLNGQGQTVDFIATDIYRIANGRIAENWHLEDNLTFLQQLGIASR